LNKAVDLDPLNMDLQAFLGAERVSKETGNVLGETRGNNWLKFIKENNFYYESISESFDKFKEALFEN
jgi:hypothetical protein